MSGFEYSLSGSKRIEREAIRGSPVTFRSDWDYPDSVETYTSMTTITDKLAENVVGKPYRGEPDVRFDEGIKGNYS